MKIRNLLLILLALCMLLPCLAACKKDDKEKETQAPNNNQEPIQETDENPNLPAFELGREFTILGRVYNNGSEPYLYKYSEIEDTKEAGEPVNAAVVERNQFIEEKYQTAIVYQKENPSVIVSKLSNSITAGDTTYDACMPMLADAPLAAANGLLYEFGQLEDIDTNKSYWMKRVYDSLSIGGYNFYCPGDINLSAYNTVQTVFFNKVMFKNLNLENTHGNIYSLVKEGKWTVETMAAMGEVAGYDKNEDGVTADDTFGIVSSTMIWEPLFYTSGMKIITKDDNDLPTLSGLTDNTNQLYDIIEDIVELMGKDWTATITARLGFKGPAKFKAEEALFWVECMYGQYELLNMTSDYGIVPAPVWNEGDTYIANIHPNFTSAMCVPIKADSAVSGAILEDMSYYSQQIIIPEYYERIIHLRNLRDDESYEMLDIIYGNISVDMALALGANLTIDSDIRDLVGNTATDKIASTLSGKVSSYKGYLDTIVKAICKEGAKQYGY